jgi:PEP-CTERM motif
MSRSKFILTVTSFAALQMPVTAFAQSTSTSASSSSSGYIAPDYTTITLPNGRTTTYYSSDVPTVSYDEATRVATLNFPSGRTQILNADGSSSASSGLPGATDSSSASWPTTGSPSPGSSGAPAAVPEPGMIGLFSLGTLGLIAMRRFRRRKR